MISSFTQTVNSINPEESYKTIGDYDFNKNALCMFVQNYEVVKELKQENRNGTHFNKVGPNINVTGKGCYYIPYWSRIARRGYRNARNLFYKYCAYHLFYGKMEEYKTDDTNNFINFAQYLPKISPLCLDFDIVVEFKKSDRDKFKRGDSIHIYKQEHIFKIVEILNNIIFDNFDIEKEDIKAYVFEKESFKFKSAEEVKDGIHIIYLLPFNVKQRWFIRQELINKLKEINFNKSFDFKVINDYNDIVDEAVITRNPWLTYGSVKVETKTLKDVNGNTIYKVNRNGEKKKQVKFNRSTAYTLSYIFDFELFDENIDCMGNKLTYETIDDMEAMLNLFDLDQFSNDEPLNEKSDKLIKYKLDEKIKTVSNNQIKTINTFNTNSFISKNKFLSNRFTMNNNRVIKKKTDINKLTPEILQKIIKILASYEINYEYSNWFMICCGIRNCTLICCNGDETKAKNYVHYFCKKDKRFSEDNFDDDYEKIKSESFKYQGKQSNVQMLIKYIYDYKKTEEVYDCLSVDSFKKLIDEGGSDYETAKYIYERYKNIMFCDNIKKNSWYVFPSHCLEFNEKVGIDNIERSTVWETSPEGLCVNAAIQNLYERVKLKRNEILKELYNVQDEYNDTLDDLKYKQRSAKQLEDLELSDSEYAGESVNYKKKIDQEKKDFKDKNDTILKKLKKIKDIVKIYSSRVHKADITKECCKLFYNKEFITNKINTNEDILCFDNGVYNFKTGTFEDPNPNYYSTLSTRYNYIPDFKDYYYDVSDINKMEVFDEEMLEQLKEMDDYNPATIKKGSVIIEEIEDYMKKLIVDDEDRNYVLKLCASFLVGKTDDQYFHIWTGNGSNGKSKFNTFIETMMGDYYSPVNSTLFTRKKADAQTANPAIANKRGKRVVICSEPENDKFSSATIKELTGQDSIETRELYSDPIKFKPQFKLIFICNSIPDMDSDDYGIWRRIRIIEFASTFDKDIKKDDYKYKKFRAMENIDGMVKNKTYASAFAWLLINVYYKKYITEKISKETKSMQVNIKQYRESCDPFGSFLDEEFKKVKQEYITTQPPYYTDNTPETERSSLIYQTTITSKYTTWSKNNSVDKRMRWADIKKYLTDNTNCKIVRDEDGRYRVIGLIYRNKKDNEEEF